jgi:hypothetical protein
MQTPKGAYEKRLPCSLFFARLKPWYRLFRPKKGWLVDVRQDLNPFWIDSETDCSTAAIRQTAVVGHTEAANPLPSLTHKINYFKTLLFFSAHCFKSVLLSSWFSGACQSWSNINTHLILGISSELEGAKNMWIGTYRACSHRPECCCQCLKKAFSSFSVYIPTGVS